MDYQELLSKFFSEEISDDEIVQLKTWLESDPENRHIFEREKTIWDTVIHKPKMDNIKLESVWRDLSSRLGLKNDNFSTFILPRKNAHRILVAAASLAILITVGLVSLWIGRKATYSQLAGSSIICSTNEGERAHITLSDSTKVFLNSASTLEYNGDFNVKERFVRLRGEAFFDVSTDPEKPFVVRTDQMTVSATGTRFNILSFNNEERIEATLEEGTIFVTVKGQKPVELRSGQQVVYSKHSSKVEIREVTTDVYTSWKENKLRLKETPLDETLRKIARKYNVTFELTSQDLKKLSYTGTFIDEPIDEVMEMLKSVSPISYKIYYRTKEDDYQYIKPRIVISLRNPSFNTDPV